MSHPFNEYTFDFSEIKFRKDTMTIKEFLGNILPITDCNPIGQRPPVHLDVNNVKSIAIIVSIMRNIDIGNITLVDVLLENNPWTWESIDGGHRKRAIRDFFQGKVCIPSNDPKFKNGKTFSQLSDSEKDRFNNYQLSFTLYDSLSNDVKGYIFRSLNTTTKVNDQETLNSYGDHPIANVIRETVRMTTLTNGKSTVPHDLFELTKLGNFKWVDSNNIGLKLEEWVARVYYSFYNGGSLSQRTSKPHLTKMYNDPNVNIKQLKRKVDKFLDFAFEMAKARRGTSGAGLSNGEKNTILNLYLYLSESHGCDLEATDYVEWYKAFSVVYQDLTRDPNRNWQNIPDLAFEHAQASICQLFQDYTRNHDSADKQRQLIIWMTSHPKWNDVYEYTLLKDRNRSFPKWMKELKLQEQGYVCVIDDLPLDWSDAEAAHIVAHSKGGNTKLDNCAMIRKSYNRDMGTMNVNEYKTYYIEQKKAAA